MTTERATALGRRRRTVVILVAGAVILTGTGAAAGRLIKSPQQAAAEAGPPEPDVLTAPVERRVLKDTVVTRGLVRAQQTLDISTSGTGGGEASRSIVTRVKVKQDDKVAPGHVLVEVSGRPVFVLRGSLPAYRDLRPGMHGDDVAQLQKALADTGFGTGGDAPGRFGSGTARAVERLYASLGYDPSQGGEKAEGTAGGSSVSPVVPVSELVYVPSFPARVETVTARAGQEPGEKLVTLSTGDLTVRGTLRPDEKNLVRAGQQVEISSETTGTTASGTVKSVARELSEGAQNGGQDAPDSRAGYAVTVTPDKPLHPELAGQDVRLTVEAAASDGKVLVVPLSAVTSGADAKSVVTVCTSDGGQRRVPVRTGISGDGYVEVAPTGSGKLRQGDAVSVGVESAARTGRAR
ncbi:efflux RND transporter periplasmic adaptor subunit [Streptomyces sp. NPDC041068]|uniref:efflux RND transporter periplasmic adaptor subunit n=1 Tax=Streptomyces sp. NPDC041068 TaxID=3155130 RepID=UPI0033D6DBCA